jgi:hypothetical protein
MAPSKAVAAVVINFVVLMKMAITAVAATTLVFPEISMLIKAVASETSFEKQEDSMFYLYFKCMEMIDEYEYKLNYHLYTTQEEDMRVLGYDAIKTHFQN